MQAEKQLKKLKPADRHGAEVAAQVAVDYGVPPGIAYRIVVVARKLDLNYDAAFALVEIESGFRHIFGHDPGGPFPGKKVTRARYRQLVEHVKAGGVSNGVGLTQPTYPGFLLERPGLWRKTANLKFGLGHYQACALRYGQENGYAVYNGGPNPPGVSYVRARTYMSIKRKWHGRLRANRRK